MGDAAIALMPSVAADAARSPILTFEQAADLEAVTRREIQRRVQAGEYATVPIGEVSPNGRQVMGIPLNGLSREAVSRHWAIAQAQRDLADMDRQRLARPILPSGEVDLATLSAHGRQRECAEIARRAEAVRMLKEQLAAATHGTTVSTYGSVAAHYGVSASTLRRWESEEIAAGQAGHLHLRARQGMGGRAIPKDLQANILAAYRSKDAKTPQQVFFCVVLPWCRERGVEPPHYSTVRRFLRQTITLLDETIFRQGPRAYKAQAAMKVERDIFSLRPGEIYCGDCRKLDITVLAEDGERPVRPFVSMWVDIRTAAIVGWVMREVINTRANALSLRMAMIAFGVPDAVYTDNGKDYAMRQFGGRLSDEPTPTEQAALERFHCDLPIAEATEHVALFAVLRIRRITAIPFQPWSKPIEPLFGAFYKPWENLVPGYCGKDAKEKPESLKKQIREKRLLTWRDAHELMMSRVRAWNTERPIGKREKPPVEFFRDYQPRRVSDPSVLDVLMEPRQEARIEQRGVAINGRLYMRPELGRWVGEKCVVRHDPDDPRAITIWVRGERHAVPEIPKAKYFEFGLANRIAAEANRVQREYAQRTAQEDLEHTVAEYADPLGAFRLVASRACPTGQRSQTEAHEILRERAQAVETQRKPGGDGLAARLGQQWIEEQRALQEMQA